MRTLLRIFVLSLFVALALMTNAWYMSSEAQAQQASSEWGEEDESLADEESAPEEDGEDTDESGVSEPVRGTGSGGTCPEPCLPPG